MNPKLTIPPNEYLCASSFHDNFEKREIGLMKTNFGGSIALPQMKLQTCQAQNMKAYDHTYHLLATARI